MNFTREQVASVLKQKVCHIRYRKVSGEHADMKCTLLESELPSKSGTSTSSQSSTTLLNVWNVEKKGWRSFHSDRIVGPIEILD